jgi:hypothetical protein
VLTSAQTDANKTAIGLDECRPTCR